jgi:hypothetical protein
MQRYDKRTKGDKKVPNEGRGTRRDTTGDKRGKKRRQGRAGSDKFSGAKRLGEVQARAGAVQQSAKTSPPAPCPQLHRPRSGQRESCSIPEGGERRTCPARWASHAQVGCGDGGQAGEGVRCGVPIPDAPQPLARAIVKSPFGPRPNDGHRAEPSRPDRWRGSSPRRTSPPTAPPP